MATYNGKSYQDPQNINLRGGAQGTGLIRWSQKPFNSGNVGNWTANPFGATEVGLYVNSGGNLVFSYLGVATTLGGGGGGGGIPTITQVFAQSQTLQVAGIAFTIDDNTAGSNNVLALSNTGAGSQNLIQLTNTGTGKDINGTSSSWSVDKAGNAVFLQATVPTITTASGNLTLQANGSSAVVIGAGSNTVTIAKAATFSSTITATSGQTALGSTSNTAASLIVTNNTITTFGAAGAANAGMTVLRSTSLTTGDLLRLQAAEGTITGNYINAYDTVGGASVFKVSAAGAVTIAGPAAGGVNTLTITEGDVQISDGSITFVDADNANSFSMTNNTGTSVNTAIFTGSGVYTGTGANSFFLINQSGATSGTVASIIANGMTSGKILSITSTGTITGTVVSIAAAGLTTGTVIDLGTLAALTTGVGIKAAHTTSVIADGGSLMRLSSTSIDTGGATNGTILDIGSTAALAATLIKVTDTALTTGTALAMSMSAQTTGHMAVFTSTGTITTTGDVVSIIANSATTSTGLLRISGTGLTTGSAVLVTGGGTNQTSAGTLVKFTSGAATDGSTLLVTATGAYVGTVGILAVTANSLTTGSAIVVSATAQTSGTILSLTGGGSAMLTAGIVASIIMGAATVGAGLKVATTGVYTDAASAVVNITASSATTGNVLGIKASSSSSFVVGQAFATPAFQVDASTASQIAGLKVVGAATGGTVAIVAIDSGSNTNLTINAKGSGALVIGGTSTGFVSIGRGSLSGIISSSTITALGTIQNTTPTAAQLLGGVCTQTSSTGAGTATLPTGTALSTAVPGVAVGDTFKCLYSNLGGGQTVTITGATGSTVIGTATVASGTDIELTFVNTGTNTWNVYTNK